MLSQIHDQMVSLMEKWSRPGSQWFEKTALECIAAGRFHLIESHRDPSKLYLARFWMHAPRRPEDDGGPSPWESADSCVLHYFARPDDDTALHCHPWPFTSLVLSGAYLEYLPPDGWTGPLGPAFGAKQIWRKPGDLITHEAGDLHTVAQILPDTWTMVRMGPRIRGWGFHPHGKPWMDRREYFRQRDARAVP